MKSITSSSNLLYREIKAIATTAKARRERQQTVLEGVHLAESFLDAGYLPKEGVVSESALSNPEVIAIIERCQKLGVPLLQVSDQLFRAVSSVENGVGVLLIIALPEVAESVVLDGSAVLLDNVQDPGNVGTILRTAAAAGVKVIYCSAGTASVWSPKVLRAAMGAHTALRIHEGVELAALIREAAVPVLATTLEAELSIYDADLSKPAAWLLGNEGQGVAPELLGPAVTRVIIPQTPGVESLNVAAATAVCLFEQRRQLLHG